MVDFIHEWQEKTGLQQRLFLRVLGLRRNKFRSWELRYGKTNLHNGKVPRDYWLEQWEKNAIVKYRSERPLDGYRALTYMMLDAGIVAVSAATTYRVLKSAGLLDGWNRKPSKKGTGFTQPLKPHEHWHIDISYLNICGTFYYFIGIIDGCSRYLVHWDIRESMTKGDVESVLQRAKELFPKARPRIVSDNGPQFIAKEFKVFVRISGMSHVRTSPYYAEQRQD